MKKHLFSSLAFTLAFLISFLSICFSSWISINPDTSISFELNTTKDRVVCYNSRTKVDYTSLKVALDSASDNQEIIVYIGADVVCNEDITIKKNVTLTIPFAGKAFDSLKKANNISSTTLYKIPDSSNRNDYGNKLGDESKGTVSIYRSCLIEMRNGADIINNGTLNLGGVCSTNGNNGYYSEINLGLASSIQCKSGSTFECYGYVKENEKDYSNPTNQEKEVFDNSLDAERYIKIESGASMISSLAFYDAPSAGGLTTLLNAKKCPFWEWDFPNLQTYTKIEAGSIVSATALLVGPNNTPIEKQVTLFSSNSKNQSMFYLSSGYVGIEYSTKEPGYSSRGFNARKANILLSGEISVGYLFVQEGGSAGVKLDTREDFLPISCRMKMVIGRSAVFKTDKKIKFLADSSLLIQENGRFEINNEIIFHKKDSIYLDTNEGIYFRHNASDSIKDARLICNGTIVFNTDGNKNGAIGAYVEHCNSNGSACFDLSGLSEDSKLSVKASEGTNNMVILISSNGEFEQGVARFACGNKYTSSYSQSKYFWNGPSVSTYNVKVKILKGTKRSIALYSLQYADDANGTNLKDSSLLNCETDGSTSLPGGKYAKINLIRGKTCVLKDSFGQIIASDLLSYFLLDRDYSIEITPNEAITVGLRIEPKNNNDYHGCGHFTFDVYESKTQNSGFIQVDTIKASGCQANAVGNGYKEFDVSKGYYFYIKTTFEKSLYNKFSDSNATITTEPTNSNPSSWNPKKRSQSPTYIADANYKFVFSWDGGGCFASGTPILMADGKYKNIEDLSYADRIMTWNFFEGRYEEQGIAILVDHGEQEYQVTDLTFSNNSKLSIIADHGLFDYDLNQFVYLSAENCHDYIGHRFAKHNAGKTEMVRLISTRVYSKHTHAYSLTSNFNYNAIANGLLTSPPPGEFYNWVSMAGKMRYDVEQFNANVKKYGLYDYSVFEPYGISYETFMAFNGRYLKIPVEKGMFSFEYIIDLFNTYKKWIEK